MAISDSYTQVVGGIIKQQEVIIGPIALEQAKKVSGLEIVSLDNIKISGSAKDVLGNLVTRYSKLFGRASIEVCKQAVRSSKIEMSKDDLPAILQ